MVMNNIKFYPTNIKNDLISWHKQIKYYVYKQEQMAL
jgi:hypothetical protein